MPSLRTMSAERQEWGTEELELLQYVKAHNATAKNEYLTRLFNEKNGRKRTPHAIRFRLKRLRKLARESVAKRFGPERSGREPRDSTNTRDGADPRDSTYPLLPVCHRLILLFRNNHYHTEASSNYLPSTARRHFTLRIWQAIHTTPIEPTARFHK
jgi:hypothetical protein